MNTCNSPLDMLQHSELLCHIHKTANKKLTVQTLCQEQERTCCRTILLPLARLVQGTAVGNKVGRHSRFGRYARLVLVGRHRHTSRAKSVLLPMSQHCHDFATCLNPKLSWRVVAMPLLEGWLCMSATRCQSLFPQTMSPARQASIARQSSLPGTPPWDYMMKDRLGIAKHMKFLKTQKPYFE